MVDFKIRRGHSSVLFTAPNVINPRLLIEEGCWYLCTDTAELFLGVLTDAGELTLKRINEVRAEVNNEDFQAALESLENKVTGLEKLELFQKITNESELPTDFNSDTFNPNVTYYIPLANGKASTYIFDKGAQCYLCTNSIDASTINALVTEAIDQLLTASLDVKITQTIKATLENTVLYGGDATPNDD
jgi:hypothetical protein